MPSPALCPRIAAPDTGISAALPRDHNNPLIQVIWHLCFTAIAGVILGGMAAVSCIKDRPVGEQQMKIEEAITSRKSVRAFTDTPVPRDTVHRILEIAQRAPSGTNTQPWHVHVAAGAVRNAIVAEAYEMFQKGETDSYAAHDYYPDVWTDTHQDRRRQVGWDLYGLLGIQKGDRDASKQQAARNYQLFDAPVGIFVTTDTYLGRGSWFDVGLYVQTIMLAARAEGLHTCPQASWIVTPGPVRRHLNIPDDQALVVGIALGHQDENAIENTLVSTRADIQDIVHFHGF